MKIKLKTKKHLREEFTGEELLAFVDDIEKLSRAQRSQFRTAAFIMMQLKRCTREEIKSLIGYTLKLDIEDT